MQPFLLSPPIDQGIQNEGEMQKIPEDWIERAARVYASNQDASRALGIAGGTFGRLCREYGIETPFARQRRRRSQSRRSSLG